MRTRKGEREGRREREEQRKEDGRQAERSHTFPNDFWGGRVLQVAISSLPPSLLVPSSFCSSPLPAFLPLSLEIQRLVSTRGQPHKVRSMGPKLGCLTLNSCIWGYFLLSRAEASYAQGVGDGGLTCLKYKRA